MFIGDKIIFSEVFLKLKEMIKVTVYSFEKKKNKRERQKKKKVDVDSYAISQVVSLSTSHEQE